MFQLNVRRRTGRHFPKLSAIPHRWGKDSLGHPKKRRPRSIMKEVKLPSRKTQASQDQKRKMRNLMLIGYYRSRGFLSFGRQH